MQKLSTSLLISAICGLLVLQPGFMPIQPVSAQEQASDAANREGAEILFEEALELKRSGNLPDALDSFAKAIRSDRSILANDDHGLIEELKKDCEAKLKISPDDIKVLELLGFVHAVCYSNYSEAITCYQKVYDLVADETVKERTEAVIERLKLSAEVQQSYQEEVTASLRDERLKSWSEMERVSRFGEESARMQQKSSELAEAYKSKDELANRVPQLEQELKDLQSEYDKANRLFHTMSDNSLYERRRRRLKDDIAEKEKEVEAARGELEEAESTASTLEKELATVEKAKEASPIRSYEDNSSAPYESGQSGSSSVNDDPDNLPVESDEDNTAEEPLPMPDNPDFPSEDSTDIPDQQKIDDYIDNL